LSGKTTNLQYVHGKVPTSTRGDLISLATEADRTLYFDFLPINIGTINGFQAKFQLYTVPGQVYYNATRKLVLRGVDGVVFVADSQPDKMDENIESLANLVDNLQEYGYDIDELPMVIQYNKRDLPGVLTVEELNNRINTREMPHFEASAVTGTGVFDTLKFIIKMVLEKAKSTAVTNKPSAVSMTSPVMNQPRVQETPPPQPYPQLQAEFDRQPVVQQSSQKISTAASQEPTGFRESQRIPSYRPYPGSSQGQGRGGQIEPPAPKVSRPYPGASGKVNIQPTMVNNDKVAAEVTDNKEAQVGQAPSMAPPLKRRGGSKKRGIFKRLFGIK
jgi:signal recognition particle receptor subunit beta